jgi:hypothetical protein
MNDLLRYFIASALAAPASGQISGSAASGAAAIPSSSEQETSTLSVPLVLLPTSSSIPVASSGAQDILQVNFSLDGKTWTTLGNIDANNWQNASFDLPINSWRDLQSLQVSLLGFSQDGTLVQNVYLDGMDVSVEYDDPDSLRSSLDQPALPADQSSQISPPAQAPASTTFDSRAKQSCNIEPYSKIVRIGEPVKFGISLYPSVAPPPPFNLQIGKLPAGITGIIASSSADPMRPGMSLAADSNAARGSFNIIVLYEEKEADGTVLPNYCQFNLVVQ